MHNLKYVKSTTSNWQYMYKDSKIRVCGSIPLQFLKFLELKKGDIVHKIHIEQLTKFILDYLKGCNT